MSERLIHAPCLRLACAHVRIFFHVARRVSRQARRSRQPNQHFFVLPYLVTPAHWHALAGRIPGIQGRVIMGRAVHAPGMG
jgi:hypothetical protein